MCDLKVHLYTQKNGNVLASSRIPINLCFYAYIILPETNNLYNCFQLTWKLDIKNIYISELSNIIPTSIQLLIPDLIFPVYKIDCEHSEKSF
jgi:hypothetical protein